VEAGATHNCGPYRECDTHDFFKRCWPSEISALLLPISFSGRQFPELTDGGYHDTITAHSEQEH
jgi:hypothetical protein